VFVILAVCVGVVTYLVGAPTVTSVVSMFILTAIFFGTYISFQQTFSSMSRSITEALLTGILVYILYTTFWMIFPYGAAYIMGIELGFSKPTMELRILIDVFNLFNPNGAYQSGFSGMISPRFVDGMHHYVPAGALVVWFLGTLGVNVEMFNRKV
jgi:ABC-type transport system involved in multi-copper enzyme maturation permease subunit